MKFTKEKESGKDVRPSYSLYYFPYFTRIRNQDQLNRADEFEADWPRELDRAGTCLFKLAPVKHILNGFAYGI